MTRNDWLALLLGLVILLMLILLPTPAAAEMCHGNTCQGVQYRQVYMPTVRQDLGRDWFVDSELDAAMDFLGYGDEFWDTLVSCELDETADPANGVLRYSKCTLLMHQVSDALDIVFTLDAATGTMTWAWVR